MYSVYGMSGMINVLYAGLYPIDSFGHLACSIVPIIGEEESTE